MPALSRAQRRVAAVSKQVKEGRMHISQVPEGMRDDVKSMMSMSLKTLTEFASTTESKLPRHAKKPAKKKRA